MELAIDAQMITFGSTLDFGLESDDCTAHPENETLTVVKDADLIQQLLLYEARVRFNNLEIVYGQRFKLYRLQMLKTILETTVNKGVLL
jgi:hypothetical protein